MEEENSIQRLLLKEQCFLSSALDSRLLFRHWQRLCLSSLRFGDLPARTVFLVLLIGSVPNELENIDIWTTQKFVPENQRKDGKNDGSDSSDIQ